MNKDLLTLAQSKALRGIAILGIILHNYCHFLGFAVKENEYTFNIDKPMMLLDRITSLNHDLFVHVMSFFGHYGVPVFLFLSGFGLVAKYEKPGREKTGFLKFTWYNYAKLLRLMFLGYIAFAIVLYLHNHPYEYTFERVAAQMLMYINMLPDPSHLIKPGPYWYFSLTLQCYIVWHLLFYRKNSANVVALILICWAMQWIGSPEGIGDNDSLDRIRYNSIGGMLPFGMGVLYARHGKMLTSLQYAGVIAVSAVVVFAGSFNFHAWLWVPAFVVMGAVATVKLIPESWLKPCLWFGGISSALFVVHPITREIIVRMSQKGEVYTGLAIYIVVTILCAWLFNKLLNYLPKPKNI